MNHYSDISYWENIKRAHHLLYFRELAITYYNKDKGDEERYKMNKALNRVKKIVHATEVSTRITRMPAPAIGGHVFTIDLLEDLFNLGRHDIPPSYLIDILERSIGVYEDDRSRALWRTINPLWWLKRLLVGVGRFPFFVLASMGFNLDRLEHSSIGKLIKGLLSLLAAFASLLLIAERLGFLSNIKRVLGLS